MAVIVAVVIAKTEKLLIDFFILIVYFRFRLNYFYLIY
jgi:hypothetical protein